MLLYKHEHMGEFQICISVPLDPNTPRLGAHCVKNV